MKNRSLSLVAGVLMLTTPSFPQAAQIAKQLGLQTGLSDSKISSGLKQALQIGAEESVKLTSRPNGYFSNPDIKILMPSNLRALDKGLRLVGYGPKLDVFVLSMNRAAEAAAPAARKIFIDAITAMTFEDAHRILSGGDTAATNYFKEKTTPQLTSAFRPVVEKTMAKNGVTQQYNALVSQYKSIPFAKNEDLDIGHYVVSKALDGLFFELGQEESKIRKDPAAQTTNLLKEVFGRH